MKRLSCALAALLLVTGCSSKDEKAAPEPTPENKPAEPESPPPAEPEPEATADWSALFEPSLCANLTGADVAEAMKLTAKVEGPERYTKIGPDTGRCSYRWEADGARRSISVDVRMSAGAEANAKQIKELETATSPTAAATELDSEIPGVRLFWNAQYTKLHLFTAQRTMTLQASLGFGHIHGHKEESKQASLAIVEKLASKVAAEPSGG